MCDFQKPLSLGVFSDSNPTLSPKWSQPLPGFLNPDNHQMYNYSSDSPPDSQIYISSPLSKSPFRQLSILIQSKTEVMILHSHTKISPTSVLYVSKCHPIHPVQDRNSEIISESTISLALLYYTPPQNINHLIPRIQYPKCPLDPYVFL